MICFKQYHNWTNQHYNENWDDWSKQRLCTNEDSLHRQRTPLSMPSFRMPPLNPCSKARNKDIISALPRCSNRSSQRLLRPSQNSWHIITLKQDWQDKQSPTGTRLVKKPARAQHMWKLSVTCGQGWSCSRHCPRPLSASSEK